MKKEAQVMEKAILANILDCWRAKTSGLELGLALGADLWVNLAAEKADRPKELAWHVGKALPEERKTQDILEKLLGTPNQR
jgi:hypothetical protein